jgi:hypothetical protein
MYMARKKTTSQKSNQPAKVTKSKTEKAPERQSTPSYVNLIYGAVTVVVLFLLAFFAVKTFTTHKTGEIAHEEMISTAIDELKKVKNRDGQVRYPDLTPRHFQELIEKRRNRLQEYATRY